ncbi:MAG: hypothetical protein U0531_12910 [Dehalococcoidia bacterium]
MRRTTAITPSEVTPHESPPVMWLPLVILAVPSIISGFLNAGGVFGKRFEHFLLPSVEEVMAHPPEPHHFEWWIAIVSTVFAVFGIVLAAALYGLGSRVQVNSPAVARPWYGLFARKYFLDDIYERGIVGGALYRGVTLPVRLV